MKRVSKIFILVFAASMLYSLVKHTLFTTGIVQEPLAQKAIRIGIVLLVLLSTLFIYSRTKNTATHGS